MARYDAYSWACNDNAITTITSTLRSLYDKVSSSHEVYTGVLLTGVIRLIFATCTIHAIGELSFGSMHLSALAPQMLSQVSQALLQPEAVIYSSSVFFNNMHINLRLIPNKRALNHSVAPSLLKAGGLAMAHIHEG